jgi:hypothetical protein
VRTKVSILAVLAVVVASGTTVLGAGASSVTSLRTDCRDGVIHRSYSEKSLRRALRGSVAEPCASALRFELSAISMSDDVFRDCTEDGKLNGRYTREELDEAEDELPSDVDEYTDCRSVIRAVRRRTPSSRSLARRARAVEMPLAAAKALRYVQRLGDRAAGRRTRVKFARRVGVRVIRAQGHYERRRDGDIVRCFAEALVTRAGGTGRVTVRRLRKVCV